MNIKSVFCGYILFVSIISGIKGQTTFYIIKEDPQTFSEIEKLLQQDESEMVKNLCNELIKKERDSKTLGIAYFYQAQAEASTFENGISFSYFQEAIDHFKNVDFDKGLAMAYGKNADAFFFINAYTEADSLYNIAINYGEALNLNAVLADAYQKKSSIYTSRQELDLGLRYLKKALTYAEVKNDQNQAKDIINELSTSFHAIGQLDSAIFYFQKLLILKKEMKEEDGLISDYSALGKLYRERGNYNEAQQNLINALRIAEVEKDTFSIASIYSEIGDIYKAQKIWQTAEEYYLDAIQLAQATHNRYIEASCYNNLGTLYRVQNKNPEAFQYYDSALIIYEQLNNKIHAADVLMNLSHLYSSSNQSLKAKSLLLEALETRKTSKDLMSTLAIKMALAKIEISDGSTQKGINYVMECLPTFEDMKDLEGQREAHALLSEAYNKTGNYKKAYQSQVIYQSVNDSLMSVERTKTIKEYDLLYSTEKKDKEIAQQNEKIKTQEFDILQKNNQLLILVGGLAILLLLAGFLFFIYRKNKQVNLQKIAVLKKIQEAERLKSIIEGEEKERKRFSRELHDGLGAVLATVKMQISAIRHNLPEAESLPIYQKAESLIDDACQTVREISHDLMPHVLDQQGLEFAINDMCQNLANHHNIEFDFIPFGNDELLDDVMKITIYRITQELLKNIIKHAEAKEVIVQMTIEDDELILIVEDDGKGFDPSIAPKGIGLENIRSRTAYLNGSLDIDSSIDQGSTFTIQLPLNSE